MEMRSDGSVVRVWESFTRHDENWEKRRQKYEERQSFKYEIQKPFVFLQPRPSFFSFSFFLGSVGCLV
jgi:hypothetical protein